MARDKGGVISVYFKIGSSRTATTMSITDSTFDTQEVRDPFDAGKGGAMYLSST